MKRKVLIEFRDRDNGLFTYVKDSVYPVEGYEPTPARIKQLEKLGYISLAVTQKSKEQVDEQKV